MSSSGWISVITGFACRFPAIATPVAAGALAFPAFANTITFETAPFGVFSGPVTEAGFTYSTLNGGLFVNSFGSPGQDMEGGQAVGGGVLEIVSASGGDFDFDAGDFQAGSFSSVGSQILNVEGFLGGSPVGARPDLLSPMRVRPAARAPDRQTEMRPI